MLDGVFAVLVVLAIAAGESGVYIVDVNRLGRRFDGIGGLSGGGATSRLLPDYPEPHRQNILDYLVVPYPHG